MENKIIMPFLLLIWKIGSVIAFENEVYNYLLENQLITTDNNYYYLTAKGKEKINNYMGVSNEQ